MKLKFCIILLLLSVNYLYSQKSIANYSAYQITNNQIDDTICFIDEYQRKFKAKFDFKYPKLDSKSFSTTEINSIILDTIRSETYLNYIDNMVDCNSENVSEDYSETLQRFNLDYKVSLSNKSILWLMFQYEEYTGGNGFFHPDFDVILDLQDVKAIKFQDLIIKDSIKVFKNLIYKYTQSEWKIENQEDIENNEPNLGEKGFTSKHLENIFNNPISIKDDSIEFYFEVYSNNSNYSKPFKIPLKECNNFFISKYHVK